MQREPGGVDALVELADLLGVALDDDTPRVAEHLPVGLESQRSPVCDQADARPGRRADDNAALVDHEVDRQDLLRSLDHEGHSAEFYSAQLGPAVMWWQMGGCVDGIHHRC